MTRGRKPKPTDQKMLAGNPGKRALNKSEPKFTEVTHVEPPDWLDDYGVTMWQMLIVELAPAGVLKITDLHNLEIFCAAYSRWRHAEHAVMRQGAVLEDHNGKFYKNPQATIVNEALRQINTFGASLGLDPAARSRLLGNMPGEGGNEFEGF